MTRNIFQRLLVSMAGTLLITGLSIGSLSALAAQSPEAIRNYNQGIEAYTQGRSSDALKKFTRAAQVDPDYADAYYNMGSIYYQMKQYEQARSMFQKSVTLNPNDNQAKYNLGLALEKLARYDEAIGVLSQIPPSDSKASQARLKTDELRTLLKTQRAVAPSMPTAPAAMTTPAPQTPLVSGKISTQTFSRGYDGPTGITIGPGGFMYVANYSKNLIYRVGANGDKTVFAQGDLLKGPIGLVYNPRSNELYAANYLLNNITRINAMGKASVLVSGLTKPYNLYLDTVNNVLYVSEQDPGNIISRINLP